VMMSTWSTSKDGNLLLKLHATGSRSGTTISGSCRAESSKWMILSSDGCLTGRAWRNFPPVEKVPFGYRKCADLDASAWLQRRENQCHTHET
jgi:hypothetical protein